MNHEILGNVEVSDGRPFDVTASVKYGARDIPFGLCRDDQPIEVTLALAGDVASCLSDLDRRARSVAAADLCDTYNGGWNEYDEVREDGSTETVINPRLSPTEFEAKLSLRAVNIIGAGVVDFYDDDEGMFWGHAVIVTSMNGVDLSEAHAELCG